MLINIGFPNCHPLSCDCFCSNFDELLLRLRIQVQIKIELIKNQIDIFKVNNLAINITYA